MASYQSCRRQLRISRDPLEVDPTDLLSLRCPRHTTRPPCRIRSKMFPLALTAESPHRRRINFHTPSILFLRLSSRRLHLLCILFLRTRSITSAKRFRQACFVGVARKPFASTLISFRTCTLTPSNRGNIRQRTFPRKRNPHASGSATPLVPTRRRQHYHHHRHHHVFTFSSPKPMQLQQPAITAALSSVSSIAQPFQNSSMLESAPRLHTPGNGTAPPFAFDFVLCKFDPTSHSHLRCFCTSIFERGSFFQINLNRPSHRCAGDWFSANEWNTRRGARRCGFGSAECQHVVEVSNLVCPCQALPYFSSLEPKLGRSDSSSH